MDYGDYTALVGYLIRQDKKYCGCACKCPSKARDTSPLCGACEVTH